MKCLFQWLEKSYSLIVAAIFGLASFVGLAVMILGDLNVVIDPSQVGNQDALSHMQYGLSTYFWGFAVVLMLVAIGYMLVGRDEDRDDARTLLVPPEKPQQK